MSSNLSFGNFEIPGKRPVSAFRARAHWCRLSTALKCHTWKLLPVVFLTLSETLTIFLCCYRMEKTFMFFYDRKIAQHTFYSTNNLILFIVQMAFLIRNETQIPYAFSQYIFVIWHFFVGLYRISRGEFFVRLNSYTVRDYWNQSCLSTQYRTWKSFQNQTLHLKTSVSIAESL